MKTIRFIIGSILLMSCFMVSTIYAEEQDEVLSTTCDLDGRLVLQIFRSGKSIATSYYDSTGYKESEVFYNAMKEWVKTVSYYNDISSKVMSQSLKTQNTTASGDVVTHAYDTNGVKTTYTSQKQDGSKIIVRYLPDGKMISYESFDQAGIRKYIATYNYDPSGILTGRTVNYASGQVDDQNAKSQTIKSTYPDATYRVYTYRTDGKMESNTLFNASGVCVSTDTYGDGAITKIRYYRSGNIEEEKYFIKAKEGRYEWQKTITYYDVSPSIMKTQSILDPNPSVDGDSVYYEYNQHGRMIKRVLDNGVEFLYDPIDDVEGYYKEKMKQDFASKSGVIVNDTTSFVVWQDMVRGAIQTELEVGERTHIKSGSYMYALDPESKKALTERVDYTSHFTGPMTGEYTTVDVTEWKNVMEETSWFKNEYSDAFILNLYTRTETDSNHRFKVYTADPVSYDGAYGYPRHDIITIENSIMTGTNLEWWDQNIYDPGNPYLYVYERSTGPENNYALYDASGKCYARRTFTELFRLGSSEPVGFNFYTMAEQPYLGADPFFITYPETDSSIYVLKHHSAYWAGLDFFGYGQPSPANVLVGEREDIFTQYQDGDVIAQTVSKTVVGDGVTAGVDSPGTAICFESGITWHNGLISGTITPYEWHGNAGGPLNIWTTAGTPWIVSGTYSGLLKEEGNDLLESTVMYGQNANNYYLKEVNYDGDKINITLTGRLVVYGSGRDFTVEKECDKEGILIKQTTIGSGGWEGSYTTVATEIDMDGDVLAEETVGTSQYGEYTKKTFYRKDVLSGDVGYAYSLINGSVGSLTYDGWESNVPYYNWYPNGYHDERRYIGNDPVGFASSSNGDVEIDASLYKEFQLRMHGSLYLVRDNFEGLLYLTQTDEGCYGDGYAKKLLSDGTWAGGQFQYSGSYQGVFSYAGSLSYGMSYHESIQCDLLSGQDGGVGGTVYGPNGAEFLSYSASDGYIDIWSYGIHVHAYLVGGTYKFYKLEGDVEEEISGLTAGSGMRPVDIAIAFGKWAMKDIATKMALQDFCLRAGVTEIIFNTEVTEGDAGIEVTDGVFAGIEANYYIKAHITRADGAVITGDYYARNLFTAPPTEGEAGSMDTIFPMIVINYEDNLKTYCEEIGTIYVYNSIPDLVETLAYRKTTHGKVLYGNGNIQEEYDEVIRSVYKDEALMSYVVHVTRHSTMFEPLGGISHYIYSDYALDGGFYLYKQAGIYYEDDMMTWLDLDGLNTDGSFKRIADSLFIEYVLSAGSVVTTNVYRHKSDGTLVAVDYGGEGVISPYTIADTYKMDIKIAINEAAKNDFFGFVSPYAVETSIAPDSIGLSIFLEGYGLVKAQMSALADGTLFNATYIIERIGPDCEPSMKVKDIYKDGVLVYHYDNNYHWLQMPGSDTIEVFKDERTCQRTGDTVEEDSVCYYLSYDDGVPRIIKKVDDYMSSGGNINTTSIATDHLTGECIWTSLSTSDTNGNYNETSYYTDEVLSSKIASGRCYVDSDSVEFDCSYSYDSTGLNGTGTGRVTIIYFVPGTYYQDYYSTDVTYTVENGQIVQTNVAGASSSVNGEWDWASIGAWLQERRETGVEPPLPQNTAYQPASSGAQVQQTSSAEESQPTGDTTVGDKIGVLSQQATQSGDQYASPTNTSLTTQLMPTLQ